MQDFFDLSAIGATDDVYHAFESFQLHGLILGRVSIVHGDSYRLYTERGEIQAEAIGALLYRAERSEWPADVEIGVAAQSAGPEHAMIPHAVLPRRPFSPGRAAGDREQEQVIATNIDLLLIVCGLDHDFNLRRIERYLTLAHASGARPVVVLNKSDVCPDLDVKIESARAIAGEAPVVSIVACSAHGIDPVRRLLGRGPALLSRYSAHRAPVSPRSPTNSWASSDSPSSPSVRVTAAGVTRLPIAN